MHKVNERSEDDENNEWNAPHFHISPKRMFRLADSHHAMKQQKRAVTKRSKFKKSNKIAHKVHKHVAKSSVRDPPATMAKHEVDLRMPIYSDSDSELEQGAGDGKCGIGGTSILFLFNHSSSASVSTGLAYRTCPSQLVPRQEHHSIDI